LALGVQAGEVSAGALFEPYPDNVAMAGYFHNSVIRVGDDALKN